MNYNRLDENLSQLRQLVESDEEIRKLARAAANGGEAEVSRYGSTLARAGRLDEAQHAMFERVLKEVGPKEALSLADDPPDASQLARAAVIEQRAGAALALSYVVTPDGEYRSTEMQDFFDDLDADEQESRENWGDSARLYRFENGAILHNLEDASMTDTNEHLHGEEIDIVLDNAGAILRVSSDGDRSLSFYKRNRLEREWRDIIDEFRPEDEEGEGGE